MRRTNAEILTVNYRVYTCVRDGNGRKETILAEIGGSVHSIASALTRLTHAGHISRHGTARRAWYRATTAKPPQNNRSGLHPKSLANLLHGHKGKVGQAPGRPKPATTLERCWGIGI